MQYNKQECDKYIFLKYKCDMWYIKVSFASAAEISSYKFQYIYQNYKILALLFIL